MQKSLVTLHNYLLLNLAELIEFIFFLSQKVSFLFLKLWNILFAGGHLTHLTLDFVHIENKIWPLADHAKEVHWGGSAETDIFLLQFIYSDLALQVPDLNAEAHDCTEPIVVGAEAQGDEDVLNV